MADQEVRPIDDPSRGGTLRQRQAAATRESIARAALALFTERGYARTTIDEIARTARVSAASVYAIFGSKREVLREIRRVWFRDADLAGLVQAALAEPDAASRLVLAARWIRHQLEVGATISMIVDEATRADPKVAEMWEGLRVAADDRITEVISGISDQLAPGVSTRSAVDVVWALSRGAVYRELIDTRGWKPDQYERWLSATLRQQLLGENIAPVVEGESAVDGGMGVAG
ncbi:TetR/AcrR family transcriptional regulator [Pseudofrankia asymbiotica]|nr:TetR/AcrR family transcriptional regulator [Pseudofrankia asymbiotica]